MAEELGALQLFLILCAGILPPLLWLWFWLKEDSKRPEPRSLLILSFFAGAFIVLLVIPFQAIASKLLTPGLILLLIWALIEEVAKYGIAFFVDFRKRTYDEPIDTMIYLITVALGFAAFENVLFLLKGMSYGGMDISLITASMRFLGATLLHVLSSATLGGIIATAYCKTRREKIVHVIWGLLTASILHTMFNFFIINKSVLSGTGDIISIFATLWVGIIFLLLFFEKIKNVTCKLT
ncbi:MAG: PrsW family glutamic-type intramembrane protease [Patescibacteria group bacterium]